MSKETTAPDATVSGSQTVADGRDLSSGVNTPVNKTNASEGQPSLSLDHLLDTHLGVDTSENHRGLDYQSIIQSLPEDARKLVSNLRNDYRKKTTEISQRRKELEEREKTLLSSHTEDHLRKAMELPEDLDLYDPAGLKRFIEAKAAEQVNSLLEPARKQMAKDQRIEQVRKFQAEHPDLDAYKDDIARLIKDKNMTIEDAYYLVKGKEYKSAVEQKNRELEEYRKATRDAGLKVVVGHSTQPAKRKFSSAYEAYRWHREQGKK